MSIAAPRVLVLGDSFIRRLRLFVGSHFPNFHLGFNLHFRAVFKWRGFGSRTVAKTIQHDLHHCYIIVVASFQPHIVILQLGCNNLTSCEPVHVGSAIDDLVKLSARCAQELRFIDVCARPFIEKGLVIFIATLAF